MSTVTLDVDAVRARFSALQGPTAFLDGPGGTQCPDSVIDAIATYLRESNANLGGHFGSSRRSDALVAQARLAAASFLWCEPDETLFGANMTTLNFALSRTVGRTLRADVLLCSPYKFFGPHLGLAYVRGGLAESWRTYKVRPAHHRFETGTLAHELLAGFVAAVDYIDSIGWEAIRAHERALSERFLACLPERCTLYGLRSTDGRVPTFAFTVDGVPPSVVAERLGQRDLAVWDGNYYAVEVMDRLGLGEHGAVRAGFVHYNTIAEVDRLLSVLEEM